MNFAILAGTVGAICTGTLSDRIGRRLTILLSDLFLIVGGVILTIAIGSISLCFGRLIVGLGLGISLMIGPIYLSECAPIGLRGQICPIYFFMYFLGLILSYYGGVLYETNFYAHFGVAIIPAAIQFVLIFFTQNDPSVFLAKKGNKINADKQLRTFYNLNEGESKNLVWTVLSIIECRNLIVILLR